MGPKGHARDIEFETAGRPRRNGTSFGHSAFVFCILHYSHGNQMPATMCPRMTAEDLDLLLASTDADSVVIAGAGPRVSGSFSRLLSHHTTIHRTPQLTTPSLGRPRTNTAKMRRIQQLIDKINLDAEERKNRQRPVTPPPPEDITEHIREKYGKEPEDECIIDVGPYMSKKERRKHAGKARTNSGLSSSSA
jgi:hypothetical protein